MFIGGKRAEHRGELGRVGRIASSRSVPRKRTPKSRRKKEWPQLDLWNAAAGASADLVPTRPLLRNRSCQRILDAIRQVRIFFPELDGVQIKVGLTRRAAGLAAQDEAWIWINPYRMRRHTIAHELTHLLQGRGLVPGGEKSADLYSLARHPVLIDDFPYYLRTPSTMRRTYGSGIAPVAGLFWRLAREALDRRAAGHRTYLRWFELELEREWRKMSPPKPRTGAGREPDTQTQLF